MIFFHSREICGSNFHVFLIILRTFSALISKANSHSEYEMRIVSKGYSSVDLSCRAASIVCSPFIQNTGEFPRIYRPYISNVEEKLSNNFVETMQPSCEKSTFHHLLNESAFPFLISFSLLLFSFRTSLWI